MASPTSHSPRSEPTYVPPLLTVSGSSDVGKIRRRNEDALALVPELGIAVVADGMGGHPGGNVASRIAADVAAEILREAVEEEAGGPGFAERFLTVMERAVLGAHEEIRARGSEEPSLRGMGTTLTAMITDATSSIYVIGHVGDSRAYRLRDGSLEQLTRDDTWVQQQIDNNVMAPQDAKRSPYAHLLTQCLGLDDPPTPQIMSGRADDGDAYLLCTDGLVGMLDDEAMQELLSRNGGPPADPEVVDALLQAANDAGGHDNITAALVRIR